LPVAVAAGGYHSLALKADGTVVAWGDNDSGQCIVPPDLSAVVAIAAGFSHSLALKSDGTVVGWGDNTFGQCTPPEGLSNVTTIGAGAFHSLAYNSLAWQIVAWGNNDYGQCNVPDNNLPGRGWRVAGGGAHSLAPGLTQTGSWTVTAWGDDAAGQCTVPPAVNTPVEAAAGGIHSLALQFNGDVVAWGGNAYGQCTIPAYLNLRVKFQLPVTGRALSSIVLLLLN
jgi:alpha-tubulin suppressor-like RCC1 family protein